jgi:hypothetical protein
MEVLAIVGAIAFFFLVVWLLKWLWNITMPALFQLKQVTYWQAFRLMIIAAILFGGRSQLVTKTRLAKKITRQRVEQSR